MIKQLSNGGPDGTQLGQSGVDIIGFYGVAPVPRRTNPRQGTIKGDIGGQIVTYQETLTPALIASLTTAEQALTVGTAAGWGPLAADFLAAINKPTAQAGIGLHNSRISAACTLQMVFSNTSGGNLTPTAGEVYNVVCIRGWPVIVHAATVATVPATSSNEQEFTLNPNGAAATASINAAGQVTQIVVTAAGANYWVPPRVVITAPTVTDGVMSGTFTGAGVDPATTTRPVPAQPGRAATAEAIINALGAVVGVKITDPGTGYTAAPTITFEGGGYIVPGMVAMITKPTTNAGVAIGNVRISGINKVAVQFVNPTAAVVTPTTPQNYSIVCLPDLPSISNVVAYGANVGTLGLVATVSSGELAVTITGVAATDIFVGAQKPTLQAGLLMGSGRVSAANTVQVSFANPTAGNLTPTANEVYGVVVYRQMPNAPFRVFNVLLTPAAVAANTTVEQTFTVAGLVAGSTVVVNKPSHQAGLAISGCRVTAGNTLGITFENVTAAIITPTAEAYTVGNFTDVGAGGGVPGNWVARDVSFPLQRALDMANELGSALGVTGLIQGI